MIIVDTALAQRAAEGRPVRVGMIGAGFMAWGISNQICNFNHEHSINNIWNILPVHAAWYILLNFRPIWVGSHSYE
jgi:hypothetical protein